MGRWLRNAIAVADLREAARRHVPPVIFHFADGGSFEGETLQDNCLAFRAVKFRPRAAIASSSRDLRTTVLGCTLSFPVMIAPCGGATMLHPAGEPALAKAAAKAGTCYVVPHTSGHSMEAVRGATQGPLWYQIYPHGGAQVMQAALERADRCDFRALVATVDTATGTVIEDSVRNGLTQFSAGDYWGSMPYLLQFFGKPAWVVAHLRGGYRLELPNLVTPDGRVISFRDMYSGRVPPTPGFAWSDLVQLRERFAAPLVVKGVLTEADTLRAIEVGAAAVVVSNHGGRMLDGSVATLRALPEVVEAAKGRVEVILDGGVRRGSDVVKALCLGARAVLVGRASLYGLAVGGETGVVQALSIIRDEMDRTMAFLGCRTIAELDTSYLDLPAGWPRR